MAIVQKTFSHEFPAHPCSISDIPTFRQSGTTDTTDNLQLYTPILRIAVKCLVINNTRSSISPHAPFRIDNYMNWGSCRIVGLSENI
ncbi:MAG TPA: hypothetical protein DCL77_06560 [Prolixibacteraceae bacterium]|nr:hypothetical protein [Prolixibacteraceae bacterium]